MTITEQSRLQELAGKIGCITSADFRVLAGCTEMTETAWRRRGTGPKYMRLGTNFFYKLTDVLYFMENHSPKRTKKETV